MTFYCHIHWLRNTKKYLYKSGVDRLEHDLLEVINRPFLSDLAGGSAAEAT